MQTFPLSGYLHNISDDVGELFEKGCGSPLTQLPREEESSSRKGLMATLKQGVHDDGAAADDDDDDEQKDDGDDDHHCGSLPKWDPKL